MTNRDGMHRRNHVPCSLRAHAYSRRAFLRSSALGAAGAGLFLVVPSPASGSSKNQPSSSVADAPGGLMCEFLEHAEEALIVDFTPEFCWIVNSTRKDDIQTAYRIQVATGLPELQADQADMWDSGKVAGNESINVPYRGLSLQPGGRYFWKVRTWNKQGEPSDWSRIGTFRMYHSAQEYEPGPRLYKTPPNVLERTKFSVPRRAAEEDLWRCETSRHPLATEEIAPGKVVRNADGNYFADFGKAAFAYLRITLDSPTAGGTMTITIGENAEDQHVKGARGSVVVYSETVTLKKGRHDYVVPTEKGRGRMPPGVAVKPFRYAEIAKSPVAVKPEMLTQVAWHYPFDEDASAFDSSNKVLNDVWDFCKYSIKATSFCGVYIDGERQRDTLHGDALVNQLCHYCVDREYSMPRYSHEVLTMSQHWATEWMLCSPLMAWYDYMYTGNDESIRRYYDVLKLKTLHQLARPDGLIGPCLHPQIASAWGVAEILQKVCGMPDRNERIAFLKEKIVELEGAEKWKSDKMAHLEWARRRLAFERGEYEKGPYADPRKVIEWMGKPTLLDIIDHPRSQEDKYERGAVCAVPNAMHYGTLVAMADIATALDRKADVDFFKRRAALVKKSINEKLFDEKRGVYVDSEGTDHASLHANMFPLAFNVVPPKRVRSVVEYVKSRGMACSVYGAQYLLEGLYNAGAGEHALRLMNSTDTRSWAHMIYDVGSTISMEAWDARFKGNLDWNHPWGAVPANIIPRYLLGVRPLTPGFGRILVEPSPGSLSSARGVVPTIRGPVRVAFDNHPGRPFRLDLEIPANTTARVALPASEGATDLVEFDGRRVRGRMEDGRIVLDEVGSGAHRFRMIKG